MRLRCAWWAARARLSFARAYPDGEKTGTFTGRRGQPNHEGAGEEAMSDSIDEHDEHDQESSELERQDATDEFQRAKSLAHPVGFVSVVNALEMLEAARLAMHCGARTLTTVEKLLIERSCASDLRRAIKDFREVRLFDPVTLSETPKGPTDNGFQDSLVRLDELRRFARRRLELNLVDDAESAGPAHEIRYGDLAEWLAARQYPGGDFRGTAERAVAADNWRRDLRRAVTRGELVVRAPNTHEPIDMPWDGAFVLTSELRPFLEARGLGHLLTLPAELVDAAPVQAAAETSKTAAPEPRAAGRWRLKPLTRADDLRRALHTHLAVADKTAKPPTASDVLSAWMANKPAGVTRVTANEVNYLGATGVEKAASLNAVADRIERCIERLGQD